MLAWSGHDSALPRPALRLFLLSAVAMVGLVFIRSGSELPASSPTAHGAVSLPSAVSFVASTSALQHARVHLLHIPKTGGSILNCAGSSAQWRSSVNRSSGIDPDNVILRSNHHPLMESDAERLRRYSLQKGSKTVGQTPLPLLSPSKSANLSVDGQNYFIFFVRSPVTRFVSAFISRLRRGRPMNNCEHTPAETDAYRNFPAPEHMAAQLYPAPLAAASTNASAANVSAARVA